jgi:hypothetical protein
MYDNAILKVENLGYGTLDINDHPHESTPGIDILIPMFTYCE